MCNLQSILDAADKYAQQTGISLKDNPFTDKVKGCDSPTAVLLLLQENLKAFKDYRDKDRKFIECVSPVVQVVHAFSGILSEAASVIPFQPASLIFAGIDVLFTAADGVTASYDALLELFEYLGNFLKRLHIYTGISLDPLMTDIVAKIMVELISILAVGKKQIGRGRLKQFAKKLLGDSEIETILKRLDRLTQEEARMTVTQTLAIVHGLLGNMMVVMDGGEASTTAIRKTLVTMQEVANGINKMQRDQLQKDSRSWISPPDPSKNHVIARRIHSGETAVWFTRGGTFKNWDLTGGLLWIHGKPGSGKSILCSSIVEQVTARRDEGLGLVAYYYFDFRDTAKQDVRGLMSSLVVQLCAKSDLCYNILSDLYFKHDDGLRLPDDDSLTDCLKEMIGLPGQPSIYIIVDALDECPDTSGAPSPRELVLNLIEDLVELNLPNVRICVVSRPEVDILEILGPLATYSVSLHDESGQQQDIADYINSAVESDRKMRRWRTEDRQLVIDALTQRADGMFRWVFCQIEALRGCFPPALRRVLEELPKTLDTTYERILLAIEDSKREYTYRLLQCLVVSIRPLRIEELAGVLAVRLDEGNDSEYHSDWHPDDARQAVFSACSSLITVVNVNGSPVVQFSHFSVKEFLMSSRLANAGEYLSPYHIIPQSAHTFLSRSCLSFLLSLGCDVEKSAVEQQPFATYAARYWVDHAKFQGVLSCIQDLMERLFDPDGPHFATWVWIYDIDRPWMGSTPTMRPTQLKANPLYFAALCGFRGLTEHLIVTHQIDIDAEGGDHGTALNAALAKGELEIARIFLRNRANVNAVDSGGKTALHRAAEVGQYAVVELLLDHKADVNLRAGDERRTPLHVAARTGEFEICQLLLKHGADVASKTSEGNTAFHLASTGGHLRIVRELHVHGVDVNDQSQDVLTPLYLASFAGHLEVVQFLVQHGAALDKMVVNQRTPLHLACSIGDLNISLFLIGKGANTMSKDVNGDIPLHHAARGGHPDLVALFLEAGVDINTRNTVGETPLGIASCRGNLEVCRFLIKHDADMNFCNEQGWTPLHSAAAYGHLNIVQLLLDHGADMNAQNSKPCAPLHLASTYGHLEVVESLIGHGTAVDVRNEARETPLDLASGWGELEVARLLIKCGSIVNSQDNNGWTPSHTAAWNGQLSLIELLLDSGADVNMRNNEEKTPFNLAWKNGKRDVASFLARRSGNIRALDIVSSAPSEAGLENSSPDEIIVEQVLNSWDSSLPSNSLHSTFKLDSGQINAFQRLLAQGADVDERDERLRTPLHVASYEGESDIAKILMKYGADVNSREIEGWTPLHWAAQQGLVDLLRLFLDNGADIDATQRNGNTALHISSGHGRLESVRFLLGRGINVKIRNVFGRTASRQAQLCGHQEVVKLLSEYDVEGV